MRQHQLKLSPVSDSASIPIQEATPKQRKSWLNLWESYFLPFKDQSTCAGKGYQGPLTAIGLQKIIFWPRGFLQEPGGTNVYTLQATKYLPSLLLPGSTDLQEQSTKKTTILYKILAKKTTVSCNINFWAISTIHFLEYSTCYHGVFEGEKVWTWRLMHEKLLQCCADEPFLSSSTKK